MINLLLSSNTTHAVNDGEDWGCINRPNSKNFKVFCFTMNL